MSNNKRKTFFLAVNTGFANKKLPNKRCIDFYERRSRNGLYCAIVGNVVLPNGHGSNNVCAEISRDSEWRLLADAIRHNGAIPGIQLSSTWDGYQGMKKFVSSKNRIHEYIEVASSISKEQIAAIFDALQRGTELALRAGFKHIQLHAAHGYIFNLMIDNRLSKNSDYALEMTGKWAKFLESESIESSIRLSIYTGCDSIDNTDSDVFIKKVASLRINYLDASAGFYNINKHLIYPQKKDLLADRHSKTLEIAATHQDQQIILSGKAGVFLRKELPNNVHVGLCRDLIANPDYLLDTSKGCTDRLHCHYFSRGKQHLTCGKWAT